MAGQVVVVTGAARGVGAALARRLTARGARVALLGLEPVELEAVSRECPGSVAFGVGVAYLSWTGTDMVRGADALPGLGRMRAELPWVFGRTYPLEPAVERMATGIERRNAHV